jgi:hypothetical protein
MLPFDIQLMMDIVGILLSRSNSLSIDRSDRDRDWVIAEMRLVWYDAYA